MNLILASGSPRRRELLSRIVDEFAVVPSRAAEEERGEPRARALTAAVAKAREVGSRCEGIIIAADTLVVIDRKALGKPKTTGEAADMLRELSGREHRVVTGLCVLDAKAGRELSAVEETRVCFRALSDEEIEAYVRTGEPLDKAGAYAIQGRGALFVERICGDFYNVVGLPLHRLALLLREVGVRV